MNDNTKDFELPEANEKLPFKYILDALREKTVNKIFLESPLDPEEAALLAKEVAEEIKNIEPEQFLMEELCGKEAEASDPSQVPTESSPVEALNLPDGKKYFRIGEVSELVGVEPYVLRYWESEFATIKPVKSGSGHRVYSRKDVEMLHHIRHLLHTEKFSIKGAKKKLQEHRKELSQVKQVQAPNRQALKEIAQELKDLIQLARHNPGN